MNTEQNVSKKRIHNIVASAILSAPMRQIKSDYMVLVRGYLRTTPDDDALFIRAEQAAREAMEKVLLEGL